MVTRLFVRQAARSVTRRSGGPGIPDLPSRVVLTRNAQVQLQASQERARGEASRNPYIACQLQRSLGAASKISHVVTRTANLRIQESVVASSKRARRRRRTSRLGPRRSANLLRRAATDS